LNAAISTPDVWVAALTYFAAGLILRICTNGASWALFAVLGFALGFAYLAKSFYFPMSFVFLLTAWLAAGNPRKTMKYAALGLVAFLLVAGPWVTVLSRAKHRLTFGDVGRLAFAVTVDDLPQPYFWQGENGTGIPQHPVRKLLAKPRLFEFAAPVGGSYPPGFDPSYWMEGAEPHFSLRGQLRVLRQSFGTFFQFLVDQMEYGVAVLFLFFLALGVPDWVAPFRKQWFLWAPSLVACLMYAVVLVEGRYVAPFILLLWVAAFSCLFGSASQLSRRGARALVFALLSITGLRAVNAAVPGVSTVFSAPKNIDSEVAEGLGKLGIQPGDKVAGLSRVAEAHWARLAGVKIVSEIPLGDEGIFWSATPEEKRKVFDVFAATGAVVVVTKDPPLGASKEGWIPLGNTSFYAYRLPVKPD
jgi:4-amino-4-deoxy-L-arabinose transferase-like glycosyltransferase